MPEPTSVFPRVRPDGRPPRRRPRPRVPYSERARLRTLTIAAAVAVTVLVVVIYMAVAKLLTIYAALVFMVGLAACGASVDPSL